MALRSRVPDIMFEALHLFYPVGITFSKILKIKKEFNEFLAKELVTRTDIGENKLFVEL